MPAIITIRLMQDLDRGVGRQRGSLLKTTTFSRPDVCGSGRLIDLNGRGSSIGV